MGAAALGGLAVTLKVGVGEWMEHAKVAAQTAAVLKSTGGIAKVSAKDVGELSSSLMRKSGIDDELIQSGENLLLTFKNVRNEVGKGNNAFDRATTAALDLSVAGFGSVESASKMMGKALNDPIKGMTALGKAGVTFSESQKDAIKALVKTGDLLGAQKIILKEVESQVGGSAAAYGQTLPGQIAILKQSFSNLAGELVGGLMPAFTGAVGAATGFIDKLGKADGARAKLDVVWKAIKDGVTLLASKLKDAFNAINWTETGNTLVAGLRSALVFLGALDYGTFLRNVGTKVMSALSATFKAIDWGKLGHTLGTLLVTALNRLSSFVNSIDWNMVGQALVRGIGKAIAAIAKFLAGVDWGAVLGAISRGIIAILKGLAGLLVGVASAIGRAIIDGILAGLAGLWNALKSKLEGTLRGVLSSLNPFSSVQKGGEIYIGQPLAAGALAGWIFGTAELPAKMAETVRKAVEAARTMVEGLRGSFSTAWSALADGALSAFDGITAGVKTRTEKLIAAMDIKAGTDAIKKNIADARDALLGAQIAFANVRPEQVVLEARGKDESDEAFAARLAQHAQQQRDADAAFLAQNAAAANAITAARSALDAALLAKKRAGLEARAAEERKQLDASNALRRTHFTQQLADLEAAFAGQGVSHVAFNKKLMKLLASFGVSYKGAGEALGNAFAQGMREAEGKSVV